MSGSVRTAARWATAPIRGYFNGHFEMLKEEVRASGGRRDRAEPEPGGTAERLAELEALVAEHAQHQARVLARLGDDLATLTERIAELERAVDRLVAAVPLRDA